jgi:hypothetical protein
MLRRIINKNIKTIGVRKLSHDSNNNNKIVEELKEINRSLNYIYLNTFILSIVACINAASH